MLFMFLLLPKVPQAAFAVGVAVKKKTAGRGGDRLSEAGRSKKSTGRLDYVLNCCSTELRVLVRRRSSTNVVRRKQFQRISLRVDLAH